MSEQNNAASEQSDENPDQSSLEIPTPPKLTNSEAITRTPQPSQQMSSGASSGSQRKPRRFAVIVGINDYSGTPSSDLDFCANDAEAFYDALRHYGRYETNDTALFSDGAHGEARQPAYTDILSQTQQFAAQAEEQDTILFFFAGHGTRDAQDSYLLTREYRPNILGDSSISLSKIESYLASSKARFSMRFFDACHSGRIGRRGASTEDELPGFNIEELMVPQAEGWACLAACKTDEYAHELSEISHGIFSFFLVRALQGEASTDKRRVTLDNLKVYVMDNIIEMTRKKGIVQTPVFGGEQAGQIVLSLVRDEAKKRGENENLPASLQRIADFKIETLAPETDDVAPLLVKLRDVLIAETPVTRYVAQSQDDKIAKVVETSQHVMDWLEERAKEGNAQLKIEGLFSVELVDVSEAPLNNALAQALYSFKAWQTLEWDIEIRTVTKHRKELKRASDESLSGMLGSLARNMALNSYANRYGSLPAPEYVDVPYKEQEANAITQQWEMPKSTVVLRFQNLGHIVPNCALVVAIVPSTLGFYSHSYLASSEMQKGMAEEWNPSSFSKRFFIINRMDQSAFQGLLKPLEEAFAQFISFIVESAKSRQVIFENMGIPATAEPETKKTG